VRRIYTAVFGDRDPVAQPGTATGTRGDAWTTYALVPDIIKVVFETVLPFLRTDRVLPAPLRELALLRTAIIGQSKFEYSQHLKLARAVGLSEEKLGAIKSWVNSDLFDADERAVMAATDEMLTRNMIEDQTFANLKQYLKDEQIMELVYVVAMYFMYALIFRALHLEYDNDTTSRLQEVAAPKEYKGGLI
jgi:alkylhydroperoxidase family enzyme